MSLVIYSTNKEGAEERLLRVIGLLMPKEKMDMCRSIDALSGELRQPVLGQRVAVLFAMSIGELDALIAIRDLLEGVKVILILRIPSRIPWHELIDCILGSSAIGRVILWMLRRS